jgi:poly(glycerol-phosphate) alpha-glucosyltransferase
MKVGILTPTLSRSGGGILPIVAAHARGLAAQPGVHVEVFGIADDFSADDERQFDPVRPKSHRPILRRLGWAPGLMRDVRAAQLDLLHQHALWQYPSLVTTRFRAESSRPVVISTQGMLEPWAIAHSPWRKRLAGSLFERANLASASCLHCSEAEVDGVRRYGLKAPIAAIPNGVDVPDAIRGAQRPAWMDDDRRVLLFLGRIHPKKGVFELLEAWARVSYSSAAVREGWRLAIAGWDDGGHSARLARRAAELKLDEGSVAFPGGLFGDDKAAAFRHAAAFILPSYSEGLPMTVLEAWSHGLPVLMTRGCNIPAAFEHGAAVEISTDPAELARALEAMLTGDALQGIAANARPFVASRFSWQTVVRELHSVYEWLLGDSPRPACVIT